MKTIPDLELERLSRGAQESPRRRMHLNIHTERNAPIQRLLVAFEPGMYQPLDDKDFATWAPKEKAAQVAEFVAWFERAQPGESVPILKP